MARLGSPTRAPDVPDQPDGAQRGKVVNSLTCTGTKTNKASRGVPIRCRLSGPLTFFAPGSIHSTVSSRLSCWPTVGRTGNLGLGADPSPVDLVGSSRHWSR